MLTRPTTTTTYQSQHKVSALRCRDKKRRASPGGLLKSSKSKPCHKVRRYINFKRIGYNTKKIVTPSGYYANYCHGHCLFPLPRTKMTLHAQIQSLAAQLRGDVPLPCCSPVRHRSLVMLAYSESDNLVLKRRKNMSVVTFFLPPFHSYSLNPFL